MSTLANAAREAASSVAPIALAAAALAAGTVETRPDNAAPGTQASGAATVPTTAVTLPPAIDAAAIRAEARAEERARIQAIVGHAEAEGRTALAHQLAFATDLAPEAAAGLLTAAPKAEAAPARTLTGATVPAPAIAPQAGATDKADASSRLAAAVKALGPKT